MTFCGVVINVSDSFNRATSMFPGTALAWARLPADPEKKTPSSRWAASAKTSDSGRKVTVAPSGSGGIAFKAYAHAAVISASSPPFAIKVSSFLQQSTGISESDMAIGVGAAGVRVENNRDTA